ncbi:aspartate-semialdehyde dehydrogenase [Anaerobacterium chartisolvens]|uniref:Aspartate-semialdehyde dehydrogenase n=1 Tax=Anaerobacterium chartisolvens TaxID=1297424 RepID=A0A369AXE5_9FIRM|nr:aspartate-semialdehyde dehydrogenase [Anaerobacterium chartisolvens]RCX13833.1 aspartate-semialdehyde dehydrogenase [Anaerobacterium chartisolvens]
MDRRLKVGILGGTGMVGQRFITLLDNHPWFEVVSIAASERSAGMPYEEAVGGRWKLDVQMPESVKNIMVRNVNDISKIADEVDMVFCAVDMKKEEIKELEEKYARAEVAVVSNNSAHRWTEDVPMVIPEINPQHVSIIETQRKRLGTKKGFISVKSNCSLQSYVPPLHALMGYQPEKVLACTYQAISGAGKTFGDWPEITDNVIPYIGGEEEKSEREPLKIWGRIEGGKIVNASGPVISAQCYRVPVLDGHMAAVYATFKNKPSRDEILSCWKEFKGKPQILKLPSAPSQFLTYFDQPDRPQSRFERNVEKGMGISLGRLRDDCLFDYKFVCLSHNTIRGAAGGGVLMAELLKAEGYLD